MKMCRAGTKRRGGKKEHGEVERRREKQNCVRALASTGSEMGGEKKRGKMKGMERLCGSCESKCGREQTKETRREGRCRRMTATD